jgi:hypothetical protein
MALTQQQDSSPPRTVNGDKTTVKSWVVSRGQFLFAARSLGRVVYRAKLDDLQSPR